MSARLQAEPALLVLADGAEFEGEAIGAFADPEAELSVATGEFVFNTALSGYQEVLTDPSYAGQVVTFTYPHIGNYGTNPADDESAGVHCARHRRARPRPPGVATGARRRASTPTSGATGSPALAGIDTRRLTRHLRDHGALPGAFGTDEAAVRAAAAGATGTDGLDLVATVTCPEPYLAPGSRPMRRSRSWPTTSGSRRRSSASWSPPAAGSRSSPPRPRPTTSWPADPTGCSCPTGPATRPASSASPTPSAASSERCRSSASASVTSSSAWRSAAPRRSCRSATTAPTTPSARNNGGVVEITSQNHNYAVDADSLEGAEVTHVNLNDGVVEGLKVERLRAFSVQYHPEAAPGPHDAAYLFDDFTALMEASR